MECEFFAPLAVPQRHSTVAQVMATAVACKAIELAAILRGLTPLDRPDAVTLDNCIDAIDRVVSRLITRQEVANTVP